MNASHEETYKDHVIRIYPDDNAFDPRDNDNLGVMVCYHRRHDLGDRPAPFAVSDFSGWADMEKRLREEHGACIVLPLYLYDHSGLRMKVGSFSGLLPQGHAEFDSGQVGFIYATKEAILKNYMAKKLTKSVMEKAHKFLVAEVEEYDQFLSGDVYGFEVSVPAKCKSCGHEKSVQIESCWGFYGTDEALKEAKAVVDAATKKGGAK